MQEDESYLNKRGLAHFWENIDNIKQNKLTAGAGISITNDVISATGGGTADAVDWGNIMGSMSNQTDLTTALNAKANTADLATVATSGSYNDLSDKPAIPAKQVFYGTCDSSGRLSNKTVACSGFTYAEGNVIYVTFSDADTYSGDSIMTMNVNSTGAKDILTQTTSGGGLQSDYKWAAGETVCFVCHNDCYLMVEAAMATPTTSGLMSVNDKNKLDGIAAGAEVNVQANWTESDSSSDAYIQNKPSLATVATSGSYSDLSNKPTIPAAQVQSDWAQTTTTAVDYIKNKPTLATVATSGSYSDLSDKPTIPAAQVNSDWNASSGVAQILNKPTFATVATSGSYNDLSNTPTIPTVNDATLTIQQNGTDVQTFTANQSTNATANITVPTATSDLANDGASGSSAYVEADELATVATTGAYGDLSGTPTIPTVNNATLTIQKNGSNVQTFTANQSTNATANITVPTKTSELTNNSGFLTSVATANIANKAVTTAKLAAGIVTMTRTVLYNNASGTTGNITASQALNKFDEVEFWIIDTNGTPNQLIRTIPGSALAIVLDIPHPGGSNTVYWNLARWYWTAGSTTLNKWGSHYEKVLGTTVSTQSGDHIKITKIVGIKFVSN